MYVSQPKVSNCLNCLFSPILSTLDKKKPVYADQFAAICRRLCERPTDLPTERARLEIGYGDAPLIIIFNVGLVIVIQ